VRACRAVVARLLFCFYFVFLSGGGLHLEPEKRQKVAAPVLPFRRLALCVKKKSIAKEPAGFE
jgi:hypothetical protein